MEYCNGDNLKENSIYREYGPVKKLKLLDYVV
jgi:hypothetical protein